MIQFRILVILLLILISSCKSERSNRIEPIKIEVNEAYIDLNKFIPNIHRKDRLIYLSDSLYTGTISRFADGELLCEVNLKNGLFHGKFKECFLEGKVKTLKNFELGYENGVQQGWHKNQKTSYKYMAINGLRDGIYHEYYPTGDLQIERTYVNGEEIQNKILNIDGLVIANYIKKGGRYYGLLGSSNCVSVFNQDLPKEEVKK